ncbi:MAG: DMT family transporter [Succinivibrio sp.]|nr:DMT family transporter [Succinivibrio sp.]
MKMGLRAGGLAAAVLSAVCYGLNPLGALSLYAEGLNTSSVLFGRFLFGFLILLVFLLCEHERVAVSARELKLVIILGLLFAISALSLYSAFHYMAAGVASTLLFLYPMVVALLMAWLFHEPLPLTTKIALVLAFTGVAMLSLGDDLSWNWYGAWLVVISILSYAVYMVIVNKCQLSMSSLKLSAFVMLCCMLSVALYARWVAFEPLQLPQTYRGWFFMLMLALIPCVFSMVLLAVAIRQVGSTTTAVLGAFEPITAVLIGLLVFDEPCSLGLFVGIVLILFAVSLITAASSFKTLRLGRTLSSVEHRIRHWRYRHAA